MNMDSSQDVAQVLFTNLQLLGLDPSAIENQYRIPCNKEMFNLPNKKGFEAIMYFLFNRLNAAKCKELFRDCWPVRDKKQEQQFRKVCHGWLTEIPKEDPDSHLPRVNPSLLMSPGGDKFYHLLFALSSYVMLRSIVQDTGLKQRDFLRRPMLSPQSQCLGPVMAKAVMSGAVREREGFMQHLQQGVLVQQQWRSYTSELVKTYRMLTKSIREIDRKLRQEMQRSHSGPGDQTQSRPVVHKNTQDMSLYDQDMQNVKRTQKVQRVRDLWRQIADFTKSKAPEREVVDSILRGSVDGYRIDASHLSVRVPDLLLRECEREIQRRNVDNIYEGGKLNILSLIHLWNLSLHLYIEKLHQVGSPNLEGHMPLVTTQVHTHHAHLANVQALRHKLEKEVIPGIKRSIGHLTQMLDHKILTESGDLPPPCIGFGLIPPTPPVSFEPSDAKTPTDIAMATQRMVDAQTVDTPEAAEQLMENITENLKKSAASHLIQGTPLYAPRQDMKRHGRLPQTSSTKQGLPKNTKASLSTGQRTNVKHSKAPRGGSTVKTTASGTRLIQHHSEQAAAKQAAVNQQRANKAYTHGNKKRSSPPAVQARVERHMEHKAHLDHSSISSIPKSPRDAHDILAEQLVDELLEESSPREVIGGPADAKDSTQALLSPLCSTRVEERRTPVQQVEGDAVAMRLFSPRGSDDEEEGIVTISAHDDLVHDCDPADEATPDSGNGGSAGRLWTGDRQGAYGAESSGQDAGSKKTLYQHVTNESPHRLAASQDGAQIDGVPLSRFRLSYQNPSQVSRGSSSLLNTPESKPSEPRHESASNFALLREESGKSLLSLLTPERTKSPVLFSSGPTESLAELAATATPVLPSRVSSKSYTRRLESGPKCMGSLENDLHQKSGSVNMMGHKEVMGLRDRMEVMGHKEVMGLRERMEVSPAPGSSPSTKSEPVVENLLGGSFPAPPSRFENVSFGLIELTPNTDRSPHFDLLGSCKNRLSDSQRHLRNSETLELQSVQHSSNFDANTSGSRTPNQSSQDSKDSSVPFQLKLRETPESKELSSSNSKSHSREYHETLEAEHDFLADVSDSVKVIQFENGDFSEFAEQSPAKYVASGRQSADISSQNNAVTTTKSRLKSTSTALDSETGSLIDRYRKLRLATHGKESPAGPHSVTRCEENGQVTLEGDQGAGCAQESDQWAGSPQGGDQWDGSPQSDSLYSRLSAASHITEQANVHSKKFTLDFEADDDSPTGHFRAQGSTNATVDSLLGASGLTWTSPAVGNFAQKTGSPKYLLVSPRSKPGSPRHQLGSPSLNTIPLSPLTSQLHAQRDPDASPTSFPASRRHRLSTDNVLDIFGEDDSLLVPASPL